MTFFLGVNNAVVSWIQPLCSNHYDLIIIPKEHCQEIDDCLAVSKLEIHSGQNELENRGIQYEAKGLTSCTKYRAIVRSKNSGTDAVCEC